MFKPILFIAFGVFGLASQQTYAADMGRGEIQFNGSVIDAPCSISPDSSIQSVELGSISNAALKNGGRSESRQFKITLEQCVTNGKKVAVTFGGTESSISKGLLGHGGSAKGVAIAITDSAGNLIPVGTGASAKEYTLSDGRNELNFFAYVQGDTKENAVIEGSIDAVASFTLAYN